MSYNSLETVSFANCQPILHALQPRPVQVVHLDDSAHVLLREFSQLAPPIIGADVCIDISKHTMENLHEHYLLITQASSLVGIIGSGDVMGQKPVTLQQRRRISREEITNNMLMTPIDQLPCVNQDALKYAQVGHIIATLQQTVSNYLLLVSSSHASDTQIILGLFDRVSINHQLHKQVFDPVN